MKVFTKIIDFQSLSADLTVEGLMTRNTYQVVCHLMKKIKDM